MKIELEKQTKIDGIVYYNIRVNDRYHTCYMSEHDARMAIEKIEKFGSDKREILYSKTI